MPSAWRCPGLCAGCIPIKGQLEILLLSLLPGLLPLWCTISVVKGSGVGSTAGGLSQGDSMDQADWITEELAAWGGGGGSWGLLRWVDALAPFATLAPKLRSLCGRAPTPMFQNREKSNTRELWLRVLTVKCETSGWSCVHHIIWFFFLACASQSMLGAWVHPGLWGWNYRRLGSEMFDGVRQIQKQRETGEFSLSEMTTGLKKARGKCFETHDG